MNYLIYIEHAAENLQFFLWYQDYVKRFSALPASERELSPEWTAEKAEVDANTAITNTAIKKTSPQAAAIFKNTDFAEVRTTINEFKADSNPFHTPPRTPDPANAFNRASEMPWDDYSTLKSSQKSDYTHKAAGAFEAADIKFQPCK